MGKKIYEKISAKQMMNRVKEPRMPFEWSINPYRGCSHGCSFCYARRTHSFLGMSADDSFQDHIFLKENAAVALEMQLAKLAKKHHGDLLEVARHVGVVAIGTATDPYQPIEGKAQLTRECLKILAKYRIPTTITTRSPLILRDLDIIREMVITSINISINTLNTNLCRQLEPATSFPLKRLETVQQLVENGIRAGIFIAPIVPYLTDSEAELEQLISEAQQHLAQFIEHSVLRLAPEVKEWFFQTLKQHYPQLLPVYAKLYARAYPDAAYKEILSRRVIPLLEKYPLIDKGLQRQKAEDHRPKLVEFPKDKRRYAHYEGEQLSFSF